MSGADFLTTELTHANFSGADLRNTSFIAPAATDTDFSGANLAGAFVGGADFNGANFSDTDLSGANLVGANLTGVVSGGITGTPTSLPSGWTSVDGTLVPPS